MYSRSTTFFCPWFQSGTLNVAILTSLPQKCLECGCNMFQKANFFSINIISATFFFRKHFILTDELLDGFCHNLLDSKYEGQDTSACNKMIFRGEYIAAITHERHCISISLLLRSYRKSGEASFACFRAWLWTPATAPMWPNVTPDIA